MRLLIDINFVDIDIVFEEVIKDEELVEEKDASLIIITLI